MNKRIKIESTPFDLHQQLIENDITCEVYNSFNDLVNIGNEWDDFVESVGGDIYMTYDWCRIWWEHYSFKRNLVIHIFRKNNFVIGILPVFYETIFFGLTWLKIAKIVGSDFTMVLINPPVITENAEIIYRYLINSLIVNENCDAVWLGPICENYKPLQQIRTVTNNLPNISIGYDKVRSPYTTFLLPNTFDDYIQSLDKRQRGNLRRDINLLNKSFQITQDVIESYDLAISEFNKFVKMHNEQWEAEGKSGHFQDWPDGYKFNIKLVSELSKLGRLKLIRLLANNNVVSYQLCFSLGNRWYWRLPARIVGLDWDKYALGRIGLIKEIEIAIMNGVGEIEAGAGHYEYKVKLGGQEFLLYSIMFIKSTLFCRLRAKIFIKISDILHFCYYRIWFNKLAPRFPLKRKPLWKLWIRTRL